MTTIEKLDKGLEIVFERKKILEDDWLIELKLHVVDLAGVVNMLESDGLIKKLISDELKVKYENEIGYIPASRFTFIVITIKGDLFYAKGGYKGAYENEKRQKVSQDLKDILLIGGSWIASIAGVGLLFFEYVKLNHHPPHGLSFWEISGVITLMPVIILFWWLWSKKSK